MSHGGSNVHSSRRDLSIRTLDWKQSSLARQTGWLRLRSFLLVVSRALRECARDSAHSFTVLSFYCTTRTLYTLATGVLAPVLLLHTFTVTVPVAET